MNSHEVTLESANKKKEKQMPSLLVECSSHSNSGRAMLSPCIFVLPIHFMVCGYHSGDYMCNRSTRMQRVKATTDGSDITHINACLGCDSTGTFSAAKNKSTEWSILVHVSLKVLKKNTKEMRRKSVLNGSQFSKLMSGKFTDIGKWMCLKQNII